MPGPLPPDFLSGLDTTPASLPSWDTAQNLLKAYFQWANFSMPLLHKPTFRNQLEFLYNLQPSVDLVNVHTSTEAKLAVFFVFEVFAVALVIMQKREPSKVPTFMADRYHTTALKALIESGLPTSVQGVQALLLIGQYSYHHPTAWATWKTTGAAMRLAVELGLHKDPSSSNDLDALTLDTRRRVFWVAYSMDRSVSFALGMPPCVSDGAITTEFPTVVDDALITSDGITATIEKRFWSKRFCHSLFRYRQLQSEIQSMLYDIPYPAHSCANLDQWQKDMHRRIHKWHDEIPRDDSITPFERETTDTFDISLHRALLLLYHPSRNIPTPSDAAFKAVAQAAATLIGLYRRSFREYRLTLYWQAVENLSFAGTALISSYISSSEVRGFITYQTLTSLVRTCSSVLWGMVEHFPSFKVKLDAFDAVTWKALADLAAESHPTNELETSTMRDSDLDINQCDDSQTATLNGPVPRVQHGHNHWEAVPATDGLRSIATSLSTIGYTPSSQHLLIPSQTVDDIVRDSSFYTAISPAGFDDDIFGMMDWETLSSMSDIFISNQI
ncbi:unnamed protein product [Clonostachys chloroleuca]|uniref:Xylanolytic transcriptional activator regulatory domain-containing protein n=1 Tax=Clonostachys chloroleuca TaxID=1926264 RepID=A0AA35PYB8_9HYPO|nr:unnamed protein product [Clonostachys chloroleuca]